MPLTFEQKKLRVEELSQEIATAQSGLVADYRGLTVSDFETLRSQAREANVYVRVIKNTLAKRAIEGTSFECLSPTFTGPVLVALSREEPNAAARVVRQFIKRQEHLEVKGLAVNGTLYGPAQLEQVADLPSKDEALAQLLNLLQTPITQFVRTLAEPQARLARAVSAISDQKKAA